MKRFCKNFTPKAIIIRQRRVLYVGTGNFGDHIEIVKRKKGFIGQ